jgi:DNA-binding MarR family transcriptional regulator
MLAISGRRPLATAASGRMMGGGDVRDVDGCTCLLLRRTGRVATQIFDTHLQPAGLTIGQFGLIAQIYSCSLWRPPMTMKELSIAIGMDRTTLTRTLKPLEARELVSATPDQRDGRARCVHLTMSGRERLAQAMPLWRAADNDLRRTVGAQSTLALSGLLSLAHEKLRKPEFVEGGTNTK